MAGPMKAWANKAILVTHITRNTTVDGVATKHKKVLSPYGTFTVPRSMDGFARASTEFVPAALICHRGANHEAGHYFAILIYRDLMWLADDGRVPTHLPRLTPQLASQVVQIWAVHIDTFTTTQQIIQRLPPPAEPDFDPPLHPSPEKKPRLEQAHCRLHYANVTNFGRQVIDWYWTRTSEPYIFVETHLDPQQHEQTCQYYTVRGRTAFGTPAWPNSDNSGNHGGILILGDQSSCLTPVESFTLQGCGYQAFLWQATELTVLIAGIYLRTNEGIQSETNATIISKLLALLQATTHPYILIGDWQNKPSTISSTVLPSKFHFDILAPDVSMLSGNVIDFSLIHTSLSGTTALTTEWAVPWRPHALLTLHLDIDAATKEFRQIQYYPPLPPVPDIDFRPWTTFQSQAYELSLYNIPVNESAQAWAEWLSHRAVPFTGTPMGSSRRGGKPQREHQALSSTQARWHLEKGQGCILGTNAGKIPPCSTTTSHTSRRADQGLHEGHQRHPDQMVGTAHLEPILGHLSPLAHIQRPTCS